MILCFDTSAINRLYDDPEKQKIVSTILAAARIDITALNVIEICGTEDSNRRRALIALLKQLTGDCRPLAIPNTLLLTLVIAHAKRDRRPVVTIDEQQNGIWHALNDPSNVDDDARREVFQWKTRLEEPFTDTHRKLRQDLQEAFDAGQFTRPRTASALIRHFNQDDDVLYKVVGPIYRDRTGEELPRGGIRQFFSDVPAWQQYLLGWAHAIFSRGIRETRYGAKNNAGTIDLWCAVYLCFCDHFITDDHAQRRALRILNVFNARNTKIISYEGFRRGLLIG